MVQQQYLRKDPIVSVSHGNSRGSLFLSLGWVDDLLAKTIVPTVNRVWVLIVLLDASLVWRATLPGVVKQRRLAR
jgi:hypothetical protein